MSKSEAVVTEDQLEEMRYLYGLKPSIPSGFLLAQDEMIDQRRWVTVHHRVVETPDGRYFAFYYETPSTEMQDGSESELSVEDVYEVFPHEVTTIVYKKTPVVKP